MTNNSSFIMFLHLIYFRVVKFIFPVRQCSFDIPKLALFASHALYSFFIHGIHLEVVAYSC